MKRNIKIDIGLGVGEMPWPDDKTSVFRIDKVCRPPELMPMVPAQLRLYAEGYRDAAEQLYLIWRQNSGCPDYLVFPIVFLYRHFVELSIKELIQSGESLLSRPGTWPQGHSLEHLWDRVKPSLLEIWPNDSKRDIENAGRLISELSEKDPLSFAFRYPVDTKGKSNNTRVGEIDLDNFFCAMRQLASFLDGASTGIRAYLDGDA